MTHLLPQIHQKTCLHVEWFSQNVYWMLAEDLQTSEAIKSLCIWVRQRRKKKDRNQDGTCTIGRSYERGKVPVTWEVPSMARRSTGIWGNLRALEESVTTSLQQLKHREILAQMVSAAALHFQPVLSAGKLQGQGLKPTPLWSICFTTVILDSRWSHELLLLPSSALGPCVSHHCHQNSKLGIRHHMGTPHKEQWPAHAKLWVYVLKTALAPEILNPHNLHVDAPMYKQPSRPQEIIVSPKLPRIKKYK